LCPPFSHGPVTGPAQELDRYPGANQKNPKDFEKSAETQFGRGQKEDSPSEDSKGGRHEGDYRISEKANRTGMTRSGEINAARPMPAIKPPMQKTIRGSITFFSKTRRNGT